MRLAGLPKPMKPVNELESNRGEKEVHSLFGRSMMKVSTPSQIREQKTLNIK